jgi:hypothetical protein
VADETELIHYGTPRHSGRYPWGSGGTPYEHSSSLLGYVSDLQKKGVSEANIAKGLGMSTTELRAERAIARNVKGKADTATALRLKNKGMSNVAIGRQMGINESSVRSLINPALEEKQNILQTTADILESKVDDDHYLDIGSGTENHMGISGTKLATAVSMLKSKGYEVRNIQVDQLGTGPGHKTTVKVLVPPGAPKFIDPTKIGTVAAYSDDGGASYKQIKPPVNIDSSRLDVRYGPDGGDKADGVIYIRPGVRDISLGNSRYAQVRIAVDGTHYLKGMATYRDDLPEGVDLQFNTNKKDTGNKLDALKAQKDDPENPFGASIKLQKTTGDDGADIVRQRTYIGDDGKEHQSPINMVNEEGDWSDWSRNLSSQFLSKQPTALVQRQTALSLAQRREELNEINSLTNPVVRQKLLKSYADGAESASVHLKAAALPGQNTHVILPIQSLKETEIYAPNYQNGTKVALVRFPHGGKFEIPELTVNNKNEEAKSSLGRPVEGNMHLKASDAVGIHPKVAERLSGADFDGDTVLVIPNNRGDVKSSPALERLKGFDPKEAYGPYDGMRTIDKGVYNTATKSVDYGGGKPSGRTKQQQMGDVSNLITDMTIKGANDDELAAAVRHSMVVIDAEKHSLNYKQSYIDNGIAALKEKYQGRGKTGRLAGASTLISNSGTNAKVLVPARKLRAASKGGPVDIDTGKLVYEETGESYVDKTGKTVYPKSEAAKLSLVDDAHEFSSGTPVENVYADYSNSLKALANQARKSSLSTGKVVYSTTAAKTYSKEVSQLNSGLNLALKNRPLERQAQLIANSVVSAKLKDNPDVDSADVKKIKGQALDAARSRVGAKKQQINITDDQWAAIQAGAITTKKLSDILDNANPDRVRALATPRAAIEMTPAKIALAEARLASGYTQAEIAESLGVPVTTLNSALRRKAKGNG